MSLHCDHPSCRRLAVLELHDLTDATRTRRCDRHSPVVSDRWAAVEVRKVCDWCGNAIPAVTRPQGGGRAKKFCSGTCRTGAHRASTRAAIYGTDVHSALAESDE
jgi:hypothetical protein